MKKCLLCFILYVTLISLCACTSEKDEIISSLRIELSNANSSLNILKNQYSELEKSYKSYKDKMSPYEGLEKAEAQYRLLDAEVKTAEALRRKEQEDKAAAEKLAAEKAEQERIEAEKKKNAKEVPDLPTNTDFTVLDKYSYIDSYSDRNFVYVIESKTTKYLQAKLVLTDADENIIDTSSDNIHLSASHKNYIRFAVKEDNYKHTSYFTTNLNAKEQFFSTEVPDSVEIIKYNANKDDNKIFVTLKQKKPSYSTFTKLKILYFNDNKLIKTAYEYISSCSELQGQDTTGVLTIYSTPDNYTDVQFYFEWE